MSMNLKRVSIEEADNGFLVNMYEPSTDGPGTDHKIVAKTLDDALAEAKKLFGEDKKPEPSLSEMDDKHEAEAAQFFKKSKKE